MNTGTRIIITCTIKDNKDISGNIMPIASITHDEYIVARVSSNKHLLIGLKDGNRFMEKAIPKKLMESEGYETYSLMYDYLNRDEDVNEIEYTCMIKE